jgi:hypothetical protein
VEASVKQANKLEFRDKASAMRLPRNSVSQRVALAQTPKLSASAEPNA